MSPPFSIIVVVEFFCQAVKSVMPSILHEFDPLLCSGGRNIYIIEYKS